MSFRVKLRIKAIKNPWFPRLGPSGPLIVATENIPPSACKVCGMPFTDAMGRPIAMGYACPNIRCPGKSTCVSGGSLNVEHNPNVMLWNGGFQ